MSDMHPSHKQASAGYADQQLYEAQQKVKARAPILIAVTAAILVIGTAVIIAGLVLLVIAMQ